MHPTLYRSLLTVAMSFLVLAFIAYPFIRPGSAPFIANTLGVILLLIFIIGITLEYKRQQRGS